MKLILEAATADELALKIQDLATAFKPLDLRTDNITYQRSVEGASQTEDSRAQAADDKDVPTSAPIGESEEKPAKRGRKPKETKSATESVKTTEPQTPIDAQAPTELETPASAPSAPQTAAAAAPAADQKAAREALEKVIVLKGMQSGSGIVKELGFALFREIPAEKYGELIGLCEKALA